MKKIADKIKRMWKKLSLKNKIFLISVLVSLILLAVILIMVLSHKKDNPVESVEENAQETSIIEEEIVEEKKLKIIDLESTSRPYAIMINNHSQARPLQSGLQDAYIIYEIIVEGGLTRYMALFLDQQTERIGSIRSARHYFIDYAMENDAIYVHHGYSPQAQERWKQFGVDRIEVSNSTGWRDTKLNVAYEHTLFTNIEKLGKGIGSKRTTRNKNILFNYSVDSLDLQSKENTKEANKVTIKYSSSVTDKYIYDEENKVYLRYVNEKEHKDYVTKQQYTFKNIITYQVTNATISGDTKGRQNLNNIGSGTGWYISEGYAIPIKWQKNGVSEQTKYTLEDGTELQVNDGNTFIQIQPTGQKLTIE